jgi:NDP-sugar pyrophosphorylase family protein
MVLAAGVGERMLPLTLMRPKPALPVLGRPIVVQQLHWMGRHGVAEAVLNLHHLPGEIERIVGAGGSLGMPVIDYTREEEILGTGGGIRNAASFLRGGESIVVCNSDFLSDIDLTLALEAHLTSGRPATLILAPERPGYSVVEVDPMGRVVSLAGRPQIDPSRVAGRYLFTGCQIIEEEVLDRIPAGRPSDIVRDVYWQMAAEGRVGAFVHEGFWWEFGSPELYLEGSLKLIGCPAEVRRGISAEQDTVREFAGALAAVGPGVQFSDEARLSGMVALGYASHVAEETVVEDSVVMPEAWIGPGCRLKRSIVGVGTELPAGFESEHELICSDPGPNCELPRFTRRVSGLMVCSLRDNGQG